MLKSASTQLVGQLGHRQQYPRAVALHRHPLQCGRRTVRVFRVREPVEVTLQDAEEPREAQWVAAAPVCRVIVPTPHQLTLVYYSSVW